MTQSPTACAGSFRGGHEFSHRTVVFFKSQEKILASSDLRYVIDFWRFNCSY